MGSRTQRIGYTTHTIYCNRENDKVNNQRRGQPLHNIQTTMETKFFKTFEDLIWYLWHVLFLRMEGVGDIAVVLSRTKKYYGFKTTYSFAKYDCKLEIIKLDSGSMVYPIQLNVTKIKKI